MSDAGVDKLSGKDARLMFRRGERKGSPTLGWCQEVKQANVVILPSDFARHFSKFCEYNHGPLPLLYESKPGEKGCALAEDSDITTDLPAYRIWKDGKLDETRDSVSDYDWSDMVTFYTGCSFSFDGLLLENGIPIRSIEQKKEISMYMSNIPCYKVGPFETNMVVSMRPIPQHQLALAVNITSQMEDVHGAPIHIGNPSVILGSTGLENQSFGSSVTPQADDVPVYWACGVTNSQALKKARCPLAITHAPGKMYISDIPQSKYIEEKYDESVSVVINYSKKCQRFSILSAATLKQLTELESATAEDPGNRGIDNLMVEGDFTKAALALSHASSVALITGFPCHDWTPPDETDGLPGIYSLAAMLQALGIGVTLFVDRSGYEMNRELIRKQVAASTTNKSFLY